MYHIAHISFKPCTLSSNQAPSLSYHYNIYLPTLQKDLKWKPKKTKLLRAKPHSATVGTADNWSRCLFSMALSTAWFCRKSYLPLHIWTQTRSLLSTALQFLYIPQNASIFFSFSEIHEIFYTVWKCIS